MYPGMIGKVLELIELRPVEDRYLFYWSVFNLISSLTEHYPELKQHESEIRASQHDIFLKVTDVSQYCDTDF